MIAGMGLYCDACERLCRAYGEWFSWNCPSCDFDMCNKCLEESRNSWAVLPIADQAPQHSSSLLCNIKGSWTLCPSGIENEDEPEQQLGERPPPTDLQNLAPAKMLAADLGAEIVVHDLRTGMVRAVHRPFGELRGRSVSPLPVLNKWSARPAGSSFFSDKAGLTDSRMASCC